jgi:hypothetical protein
MTATPTPGTLKLLNLLVPGIGLILAGRVWLGLAAGLVTTVLVATTIAAFLLFPDDFDPVTRGLVAGGAGGAYLGVQIRLVVVLREVRHAARRESRNTCLQRAAELVDAGAPEQALALIEPLYARDSSDLHVIYRRAQALTAAGRHDDAILAWRELAERDRHRLYAVFWRSALAKYADAQD